MSLVTKTLGEIVAAGGGEIRTGPYGSLLHSRDYSPTGTPVVLPRDIRDGRVSLQSAARVGPEHVTRLAAHCLEPGDVVYGRRGDLGRRALVGERETGWLCGTGCLRIRLGPESAVDPRFLYYYLGLPRLTAWIRGQAVGATLPNLNSSILKSLEVTYPQLPIQRRIVEILAPYDELIANNQERIELLENLVAAVFREWFVHFRFPGHEKVALVESPLGEIPTGWTPRQVADVTRISRGCSYRSAQLAETGGRLLLTLKCIAPGGGFRYDGPKRYTGPYKESQTARPGDVVMAVTDVSQDRRVIARVARVPDLGESLAVLTIDLVKILPQVDVSTEYLYGLLRYTHFADEVQRHANGANVLHLIPARIGEFRFPLPPRMLIHRYTRFAEPCHDQRDALENQNANLRRTRDLLLPKLLAGELAVSDAHILPTLERPTIEKSRSGSELL